MDKDLIKERQGKLINVIHEVPIIKNMGMHLSYNEKDEAVWDMPYNQNFDHGLGGVHGGIFATLLDNAGWFTVAPRYDYWITTVEFQIRLLEHVKQKDLQAVGHIVRLGKQIATTTMEVRTSQDGKLVAIGSGTFSVTSVAALIS